MKTKKNPPKRKTNDAKTSASGNVIRTILREELKAELQSFEKKVDQKFVWFETKIDFKLKNLETRTDEKARQYRNEVLTSNDKLAKTLEDMRDEITIGDFQTKEKLRDNEGRIKILESA